METGREKKTRETKKTSLRKDAIRQLAKEGVYSIDDLVTKLGELDDERLHASRSEAARLMRELHMFKAADSGRWVLPEDDALSQWKESLWELLAEHSEQRVHPKWLCVPVETGYAELLASLIEKVGIGRGLALGMIPSRNALLIACRDETARTELDHLLDEPDRWMALDRGGQGRTVLGEEQEG